MNPFFWMLVLLCMVAVWFLLRDLFVDIGSMASNLLADTKDILNSDEFTEDNDFEEIYGGNKNE